MSATTTIDSRVPGAEPYKGDDWAQSLSRWAATPMFLMGVMAVLGSLALGIAGGVNTSRFFAAFTHPNLANLGRSEVLAQWTGAVAFLGMGFILSGVVMYLVNIVRTLRDAGRDVQKSLGAQPLKLRKPWSGELTPYVMMMGVMAEIGAFVAGIVAAVRIGSVNPAAIANPATATHTELVHLGVARAATMWLPGVRFSGLAVLLTSVVLVLLTIQKTLRFQAARITEIADRTERPSTAPTPQPARPVDLTTPQRPIVAAGHRPRTGTPHAPDVLSSRRLGEPPTPGGSPGPRIRHDGQMRDRAPTSARALVSRRQDLHHLRRHLRDPTPSPVRPPRCTSSRPGVTRRTRRRACAARGARHHDTAHPLDSRPAPTSR